MRIQFCGADRTVTGSCHLLEVNGKRLLLDLGMYQGSREFARDFNQWLPQDTNKLDAIILSHGHLDHCGKLPVATRSGFNGPIYCTAGTAAVARVVLLDSAEIQQEDAAYLNRRSREPGSKPVQPLYTIADAQAALRYFKRVNLGQKTDLGSGVAFTLFDAGHILGSAYVLIEWTDAGKQKTLLFTADVGRYNTPILKDPTPLPGALDYVISESTYGDRKHGPMADVGPQLLEAVKDCIARKSRLIVPSFAVGRTQTILWYMQKFISEGKIPAIPVFVDSPMGVEVSKIHSDFPEYYDDETKNMLAGHDLFGLARVTFAVSSQDSRKINSQQGPCVIIASSPTCEFGRVLHHLKVSIERQDDLVIFVGWTTPNTLGRRLQDSQKRVRILDRWYDVKCRIQTIHGLSAHADGEELLRFLQPTLAATTTAFVVHGEVESAEGFAARLTGAGVGRAIVPAIDTSVVV